MSKNKTKISEANNKIVIKTFPFNSHSTAIQFNKSSRSMMQKQTVVMSL